MRPWKLLLAVTFCLAFGVCRAEDDIGLYFDASGKVSCANVFFEPIDVYVIASDLTYPVGIGGGNYWRGQMKTPAS